MSLADAKIVLNDVLDKSITDSILNIYILRDSLNSSTITLQVDKIRLLQEKCDNQALMSANLDKIIANKDQEIKLLNDVIKQQKKEIRKQKILKVVGFTAAVVLPIASILYMAH